jgi:hypothetical protein
MKDNEVATAPAKAGFSSPAKPVTAVEAVEAWYARHFHRAALEGRAPISTADKADLVQAIAASTQAQE